jgi:putative DNA primase/helicase
MLPKKNRHHQDGDHKINTSPAYDYREKIDLLTASTEHKGYYVCPNCQKNKFGIDESGDGASCLTGGCTPDEIRKAIDQLEGKSGYKPQGKGQKKTITEYFYRDRDGNQLAKTVKSSWVKPDGEPAKKFSQAIISNGEWCWKPSTLPELKKQIPIYRYAEVKESIAQNQQIFIVEGEKAADALWSIDIPATTTIGGSGGYKSYGEYSQDLTGARLVLCPDRDRVGLKYIANFAQDFNSQVEGYCLAGEREGWSGKPSDGRDLADDVLDRHVTKATILASIISVKEFNTNTSGAKSEPEPEEKKVKGQTFNSSIDGGLVRVSDDGGVSEIGDHLVAIARVNNPDGDGAAILLEFLTIDGSTRRWTMPRAALSGDGSLITEALLAMDYSYRRGKKSALLDYLHEQGKGIDRTFTITDSTGWVNTSFVTQTKTYGDNDLRFRDVENVRDTTCEIAGTLQCWTDRVAKFCGGNSRLIFALGIAYAAPLLEPLEIESGGFHFFHSTSAGKTTLLMVAASVVGIRKIPQWNTTANGLEATATAHNNMLLPLDEIGEANEKEVGKMAYMLANGQGKTRMTKQLTNRKPKTWKLLFASTGEVGMAEYIKQAGVQVKGGQEVRMPDIPAVPKDSTYGVFENIHGAKDSKEFAQALELACAENRGTAIDAYLSRLVVDLASEDTKKALRKRVLLIADKLTGSIPNFAIRRVANRFALVQVALGLAHSYDLLPFPVEDIDWAVSTLFQDWLTARGGDGSIEVKNACDQIGYLLTTQETGERFFTLPDNGGLKPRNPLGYRKLDEAGTTEELWVYPAAFKKELCEGGNPTEIAKELISRGWLYPNAIDSATRQRTVKNKASRYYVFREWGNTPDGADGTDGNSSNEYSETDTGKEIAVSNAVTITDGTDGNLSQDSFCRQHRQEQKIETDGDSKPGKRESAVSSASPSVPSAPSAAKTSNPIPEATDDEFS